MCRRREGRLGGGRGGLQRSLIRFAAILLLAAALAPPPAAAAEEGGCVSLSFPLDPGGTEGVVAAVVLDDTGLPAPAAGDVLGGGICVRVDGGCVFHGRLGQEGAAQASAAAPQGQAGGRRLLRLMKKLKAQGMVQIYNFRKKMEKEDEILKEEDALLERAKVMSAKVDALLGSPSVQHMGRVHSAHEARHTVQSLESNAAKVKGSINVSAAVHQSASRTEADRVAIHAGVRAGEGEAPQARRRMRERSADAPAMLPGGGGVGRGAVSVCGARWPGPGRYVLLLAREGREGVEEAAFSISRVEGKGPSNNEEWEPTLELGG